MARVRASNERWARNRQQLDVEFRRIDAERAKQQIGDQLLERLGDLVAQMLCPDLGGEGQHEKRLDNGNSERTA